MRMAAWEYLLYVTAAFSGGFLVGWLVFA